MQLHNYTFEALGTQWQITTHHPIGAHLQQVIQDRIDTFDQTYSRFRDDSLVTEIARRPGTYRFPDDARVLFAFYRNLYDMTAGKVTPLIGRMMENAGYDAAYSFQPRPQAIVPQWDDVLRWKGMTLQTTQPVTLDFGAAGKGYLVDLLSSLLEDAAIDDFVVDGSGDLRQKGTIENSVGLEHPNKPGTVIGRIDIQNRSLCASATNRRTWGDLHHIFNPSTKQPVRDVLATWVVADEAMVADGLATALFFSQPEDLAKKYDYEYVRMHTSGAIDYSNNFSGQLF